MKRDYTKSNIQKAIQRQERRDKGLCPTCGAGDLRGFTFCKRCRLNRYNAHNRLFAKYKEQGRCKCSREIPENTGSKIWCPVCRDSQVRAKATHNVF